MYNFKSPKKIAVVWIRDGVLVDRMYINPVAFAFASWQHILPEYKKKHYLLEDLINFGFAKSGFSAKQKMQLFNKERGEIIQNIEEAANDYDDIATKAAESAIFFEGAVDLLTDLKTSGVLNFITSAVNQKVLDEWKKYDDKGRLISPYLTEILGARDGFVKGKDHFAYIVNKYEIEKIYYVADAVSEIETGKQYSRIFNIVPIGFAHVITVNDVMKGVEIVKKAVRRLYNIDTKDLNVEQNKIALPDEDATMSSLKNAGAEKVITEGKEGIMRSLRNYFLKVNLIR